MILEVAGLSPAGPSIFALVAQVEERQSSNTLEGGGANPSQRATYFMPRLFWACAYREYQFPGGSSLARAPS